MNERKGILAVDDSLAALKLLTDILMREGYAVRPASSGKQAIASVTAELPELVLLDISMPDMNGFEVCTHLKNNPASRDIPVLFISASTDKDERVKGFEAGAVDFIPKPFQRDELLARIRTHLELSHLQSRLETLVEQRTDDLKNSNEKLTHELIERKKIEIALKQSIEEKEILIRELYHRTKNNMQVICSMFKLCSYYKSKDIYSSVFKDMENRIFTMALVHHKLFQSKNLSYVYFHDFTPELCELLFKSYDTDKNKISLKLDIAEISALIDVAVPCALALNELMINSLKHAFTEDVTGEIKITIKRLENEYIEILYSDNGAGTPAGFNFEKDGKMGIQTVYSIGRHQLQGKVEFKTGTGVECKITFHEKHYNQRI